MKVSGRLLLCVFLSGVTTACSDGPNLPRPVEGAYTAVEANGSALPATIFDYPSGAALRLVHGSLILTSPDTARVVLQTRYVEASGAADAPVSDTLRALYRVDGSTIEFTALAPHPLQFASSATIEGDGSVRMTVLRRLPPSLGFGTYPVEVRFRR